MLRMLAKSALVLLLLCVTAVSLIRAQPRDERTLRAFLAPPEGCVSPCWEGIRVGVSSGEQAMTLLRRQSWASNVRVARRIDAVTWRWNGALPALIDPEGRGIVSVGGDSVVTSVALATEIALGDLVLLLGKPDRIVRFPYGDVVAVYDAAWLEIRVNDDCLTDTRRFWAARSEVRWTYAPLNPVIISEGSSVETELLLATHIFGEEIIDTSAPDWMGNVLSCGG
jgi:hypothetical protein